MNTHSTLPTAKLLNDEVLILSDLRPGDEAFVHDVDVSVDGQDRLRDMGLINGSLLRVIKYAPLGDPMEIKIRGYYLSIRKSMAKRIWVRRRTREVASETQ
ncbi:MAG: ferrous iron transport protein A [Caldithrix sp.]|nr:ferrous iron transport protein A [Caldithrix sp.]